ncbi:MAG: hypothetical protein K6G75_11530 [Lachnospiraceae bacterium]|nr:hypothetical protein [Lachnospiraceae bacterium]
MSSEKLKKISNVLSAVSIGLLLIALLFGFSFIKVGVQNLVAIDNVNIDLESSADSRKKIEGKLVSANTQISQVSYFVDDKEYTADLQVYTDEYKVGDTLDVYISIDEPTNVNNIRVPQLFISYYGKVGKMMLKIGIIIVGVCCTVGIILLIIARSMRKKIGSAE